MDISVAEFARQRGISRQRALALIKDGQISARRVGRSWVIAPGEINRRAAHGRPLGRRMVNVLIDSLSGHPLDKLEPQDRFFATKYLDRLRSSKDPASLLHSWMRSRQIRTVLVAANPADLVDIGRDARVIPSGISDQRSGMSTSRELEGYVSEADLDAFLEDNLLVASGSPNVLLHVVEQLPPRPVPFGLMLADLADWNRPREDGRIIELIKDTK